VAPKTTCNLKVSFNPKEPREYAETLITLTSNNLYTRQYEVSGLALE
jgi:hypothetical protein